MKAKLKGQKIVASVVIAAMSIAFIPKITGNDKVNADVVKNQLTTCLGTSGISAPVAPASADAAWQGSYVYFGTYGSKPIKFRVLSPKSTAYSDGGPTLFLDSDKILFKREFDDDSSNQWADSELKTYLNETFLTGFTSPEQGAIVTSKGNGGLAYDSFSQCCYGSPVSADAQVFILDASEVTNPAYGYSSYCGWDKDDPNLDWYWSTWTEKGAANHVKSGADDEYWLRAAHSSNPKIAGQVDDGGSLDLGVSCYVYSDDGVAPALNVDLSKIIFSTAVDGEKGAVGTSYKLTILDNSLSVTAGTASLSGSKFTCSATGNADQVSLLITDGAWDASGSNIKYYGAFTGFFDLSSAGLKADEWGTKYQVYLVAEDINGEKETDYASKPVRIDATLVDTLKGWLTVDGKTYYCDDDGNTVTGWKQIRLGKGSSSKLEWFYFDDDGVMQTGRVTIDGKKYQFTTSGVLRTGWITHGKNKMYCTKEDGLAFGWKDIDGSWYYFNDNGVMQTGWQNVNGTWYYMDDDGKMLDDWQMIDGVWYYLGSSGAMKTGWQLISGAWFYFGDNGVMRTGWQLIGGVWYYFGDNGVMRKDWQLISGTWYYFGDNGVMKTGWQLIGGVYYFFKSSGAMAANEWCDGFWLNSDGSWTYKHKASWRQNSTGWWYGDESGWYAKSETLIIDGLSYTFDDRGYWIP